MEVVESRIIYSSCTIIASRERPRWPPSLVVRVTMNPEDKGLFPGGHLFFSMRFNAEFLHTSKMK